MPNNQADVDGLEGMNMANGSPRRQYGRILRNPREGSVERVVVALQRFALATIAGAMLTVGLCSAALAQDLADLPEAPRVQTLDRAGVDVRSGEYQARGYHIGVGPQENPRMSKSFTSVSRCVPG